MICICLMFLEMCRSVVQHVSNLCFEFKTSFTCLCLINGYEAENLKSEQYITYHHDFAKHRLDID